MMNQDLYAAVDGYLEGLFGDEDPVLAAALERSAAAGLPTINVSPTIGRFLHVMVLACQAKTVLEIGTLGGYSAIWLARALPPDGRVVSLEVEARHAAVARDSVDSAGIGDRVDIRVGDALDLMAELQHAGGGPFDMVFIDADKETYRAYLDAAIGLCRAGSVIIADNVIRRGRVMDSDTDDEVVEGARRFNAAVAADPRVTAAFIQQVGVKGHDGMAIAVVADPSTGAATGTG